MAESLQLLSREREAELRRAAEARAEQARQERLQAEADDYHHQIRVGTRELGEKAVAADLGIGLSTLSNWLSCEPGRGFPHPILLLHLRRKLPWFALWEREHAETLVGDGQLVDEIENVFLPELGKRDQEKLRALLRRRRGK